MSDLRNSLDRIKFLLTFLSVLFCCAAPEARAQAAPAAALNSSADRMRSAFETVLAEVEQQGRASAASIRTLDEVVAFRDRWWAPGGPGQTQPGLNSGGSVREAYELRARAKLMVNDHGGALSDFATVLMKDDPGIGPLSGQHFERLFGHIDSHKTLAERMADIDAVIKLAPGHGLLFMKRAGLHESLVKTAADLETAMRLSPKWADIYESALEHYFQLQDGERALAVLDRAVRELPLNFRFHRLRADVLRGPQVNDAYTAAALERLTKAINECSCRRSLLYYYYRERASVNFDLKRYDATIADATVAIDIMYAWSGGKPATPNDDPDDWTQTVQPFFFRAESYIAKGMYKEALADLDVMVDANGWGSDHRRRAEIRCKLGDSAGAKEDEKAAAKDGIAVMAPCK